MSLPSMAACPRVHLQGNHGQHTHSFLFCLFNVPPRCGDRRKDDINCFFLSPPFDVVRVISQDTASSPQLRGRKKRRGGWRRAGERARCPADSRRIAIYQYCARTMRNYIYIPSVSPRCFFIEKIDWYV
eukprot:GEMP01087994.1.p1 GENE.GEMP01087994.1~~GEMP01087994.1.p1  ORF type:complete len:129 (+),score=8.18 GEMP01087994.1:99-485(+)